MFKKLPETSEDWYKFIIQWSQDRCDLDILLKDAWRHKIVVRDVPQSVYTTKEAEIIIDGNDYIHLKDLLRKNENLSLRALAVAAFHIVLGAYGHGSQTVVAFLDTSKQCNLQAAKILPVFIDHTHQSILSCVVSLEKIESMLKRDNSFVNQHQLIQRCLFDAAIMMTNFDFKKPDKLAFPLFSFVFDNEEAGYLKWTILYAADLFESKVISGILEIIREIILQIVYSPNQIVKDLELVSKDQKEQLLKWNDTDGDFPAHLRLNQLVESAVKSTPNLEALVFKDKSLTYNQLNILANNFAHSLIGPTTRVQTNDLIALYLDKDDSVIITILGIWKAGAAFVPIDLDYPAERVNFILQDSSAKFIITNQHHIKQLQEILKLFNSSIQVIEVESILQSQVDKVDNYKEKLDLKLDGKGVAYVTYTSGTTGVPKGVPKIHCSVVNSITDLSMRYSMLNPGTERVALFSAYVFEPFLRQMLIALINSQVLVVVPDDIKLDPDRYPEFLNYHRITYLNGTGSVLQHFDLKNLVYLKKLLLVGEELTMVGLRQLRKQFRGQIINEYAFTETAFVTSIKQFAKGEIERTDRSIGRPLRNVRCYVLSQNLKQLPIGAIGELYIGGIGVASGYINRDDLTKERFLSNPFQTEDEKRLNKNTSIYKTGDLARVMPNGEFEYMGRSDFQLKLNGVRVEPGEIEAIVMEFPGIKKCVVVVQELDSGYRYLVGYFVPEKDVKVSEENLIVYLEERLIRVMIPARMVQLQSIPVNINGKVDRSVLPKVPIFKPTISLSSDKSLVVLSISDSQVSQLSVIDTLRYIWGDVLGASVDQIDQDSDFFRLGGQSISCILLIARIRKKLGLNIDVEDVFKLRTLANLAYYLEKQQQEIPEQNNISPIGEILEKGQPIVLRANGLQQGLLYHALKTKKMDDAYIVQSVYRYRSKIHPNLLKEAWEYVVRKYPSLRLHFEWDEEPLQIINEEERPLNWYFEDISAEYDTKIQEARIIELQRSDRAKPYNVMESLMFRVYLIKQRNDQFTLIFSCHHIIIDGWSLPILHDEVHRVYLRLLEGTTVELEEDTAYIASQRYWVNHLNDWVAYWLEQIEGIEDRGDFTGLLNAKSRYKVDLANYDKVLEHREKKLCLGTKRTLALKSLCIDNHLMLHSVLQFVWHKVLNAIGGGQFTVVGTIVSGRNLPIEGIEQSIGLFINTLPLVVNHTEQESKSIASAIADIQSAVNTMNSRSIVELGRLQNGIMKRSLFDSLMVLENYPRLIDDEEAQHHKKLLNFERSFDVDKVDHPLAVVAREDCGELVVNIWYAGEIFDDTAIDTLIDSMDILFNQLIADISIPVHKLEHCSEKMLACFEKWNHTENIFDEKTTLHKVFEHVAARYSDSVAVVFEDTQLLYSELDNQANQLAYHLHTTVSLYPNDFVALVLDKSDKMISAILAIWKSGAAYVPIDPSFPDERISFMLEDTKARIVLTNTVHAGRIRSLVSSSQPVLEIEKLAINNRQCEAPITSVSSTDLAYAIYTSGTTGKPKAVLVEHRGVVNLQVSLAQIFSLSKDHGDEALLSFSNYVFDHFVEQMTDALLNGQKLVVLNDDMRADQIRLLSYIAEHGVTYLSGTPSVLSLYNFSEAKSLTRIDAIGEDFTEPVFNKIRETFKGTIINGYGPTEVSITTHKRLYGPKELRLNKSIGYPVANTKCYVLNRSMKRVPVGGIGELYIGGIGVTCGYLNQDHLTKERFLYNPFQTKSEAQMGSNARIYKTGDLVRWLDNGELEYLGRTDFQIKIRGHRVELGEIETVLSSYPGISRSFIIVRDHQSHDNTVTQQKYLVGFYISDQVLDEQAIKRYMRAKLSEAIIPTHILRIEDIPVTANGKLDVKKLPDTDLFLSGNVEYVAPTSSIEIKLCEIWSKVLNIAVDRISVHDDFFRLGGDSIRAISLAQSAKNTFRGHFSVPAVFEYLTITEQAQYIQQLFEESRAESIAELGTLASGQTSSGPISLAQQRIIFIDEFEGGSAAYNIPFCLEIHKNTVRLQDMIKKALRKLVCRHSALRTLLKKSQNGEYIQQILNKTDALVLFQISEDIVKDRAELDKILIGNALHIFRLDQELPIRVGLFSLLNTPEKVYLDIVVHHSCFDGWSWNIFYRELMLLSSGVSETNFKKLELSYLDFAIWQRQHLSGKTLAQLSEFWVKFLNGSEPVQLPQDWSRPSRFNYLGRELEFRVDIDTTRELKVLARSSRISLYSILLGAYCLMINTFNGQNDLIIGTPFVNRGEPEFEGIIGFFANLLALRIKIDCTTTIYEYLRSVGAAVIKAQIHNEMPFEELIRCLNVENDTSRNPVVQNIFTLQDSSPLEKIEGTVQMLVMEPYKPNNNGYTMTKFDTTTTLIEVEGELIGNFTYAASLFDEDSVQQFVSCFQHILKEFVRLSQFLDTTKVADICLVDQQQIEELLMKRNDQEQYVYMDTNQTVQNVFEQVAARYSDSVAVVFEDTQLLYSELDNQANQLAYHLHTTVSLYPNDFVALVLDKSDKMITAILAIWKSGAAYVPIDPSFPDERISFMLEDTKARIVLTNTVHAGRIRSLVSSSQPVLEIEKLAINNRQCEAPITSVSSTDLAYAIYTSGTTGKPKAVLVEHHSLLSFLNSIKNLYLSEDKQCENVLFLSNYVFDFSVEQIVLSILSGNRLIVPTQFLMFQDDTFYDLMNRQNLTYLSGTPTQIDQIDLSRLKSLRTVLVAGEAFLSHHFNKIKHTFCGMLYCAYGTTETTVYNTVTRFDLGSAYCNTIGTPLSNTRLYVLGNNLQLLPKGAVGELCLAGECVARGYLNQSGLTNERFIVNPYKLEEDKSLEKFAVIYKTGDLVRWQSNKNIQYISRNDEQIKINGVRIELAEIETVLAEYPGIKQCAVLANSHVGNALSALQQLTGYFVTEKDIVIDQSNIFAFLQRKLIPTMVPRKLIQVHKQLPMTINGKLNTRALPQVPLFQNHVPYVPPRNRLDATLCNLWRTQLNNVEIGINDNFFRCGGDSIKAMILTSILQKELGRNISVKHLFDFPSVREFVDNILQDSVNNMEHINEIHMLHKQHPLIGVCPMLPIQKWFFSIPLANWQYWNQHFALNTPQLDIEKLRIVLNKLVDYHDAFRLRYRDSSSTISGQIEQFYDDSPQEIVLHTLDVSSLSETEIKTQLNIWQSVFDLKKGPIWCAVYLYGYNDGSARVWLAMHHLIVDTVSWQILARDLEILYFGGNLGQKNISYHQWVEAVQNYVPAEGEEQLWQALATKVDTDTKDNILKRTYLAPRRCESFQLDIDKSQALLKECNLVYDTHINDLLLTALGFALRTVTKQPTNYITLESHGRSLFKGAPEIRDTMGWFTTMYPFAIEVFDDIASSILNVKSNRIRIPHYGIGYGVLRGVYGSVAAPLPGISFNYLGQLSIGDSGDGTIQTAAWKLDTLLCGSSKDKRNEDSNQSVLDITMYCARGHLVVEIDSCLEHQIIQQLMLEFKISLEKIVSYTLDIMNNMKYDAKKLPFSKKILEDFEPYILANENINSDVLFVFPPGEGGAESYLNNIAKHFDNTQLVLFNNIHLFRPMESFNALAQYYIKYIKRLQPIGPYNFLGWSFGGVLALEIALQLARGGDKIKNLIFIDSYFDVRNALEQIGLHDIDDILDPINYYYDPSASDLEALNTLTSNILIFKAGKMNNVFHTENQKLLFNYYNKSQFNNLDKLFPLESITLEMLPEDTHHSWVENKAQVISMSLRISTALYAI